MSSVLVFPGCGVVVFSHEHMAKNNPTIAKLAAMAGGVSWVTLNTNPVHSLQQLWGGGASLSLRGWVGILKGLEEGTGGRKQLG